MFTVYLDQNILGELRECGPMRMDVSRYLARLKAHGAVFVFSDVHVEECRAYHAPAELVQVLDELDARYMQPQVSNDWGFDLVPNKAKDLILDGDISYFARLKLLTQPLITLQYTLGWLSDVSPGSLRENFRDEIDLWLEELEQETRGAVDTERIRKRLLESLNSPDLKRVKDETIARRPKSKLEWDQRYTALAKLEPEKVAEFIFAELGDDVETLLHQMFPKHGLLTGQYQRGALASLALLLFLEGVGRDARVKKGSQNQRRKRFLAQSRDSRHIEAAASCDLFVSYDLGAITLASAVFSYAGVNATIARAELSS